MKGRVIKSTGSWYNVLLENGQLVAARTRGKLRLEDSRETNPVAVGDFVEVMVENENATIKTIEERTNQIVRQSAKKNGQAQVLASNVDQALLLVTKSHPRTSTGFIDRFLVSCEAYGIPQLILINKKDLVQQEELHEIEQIRKIYEQIGVKTFFLSLIDRPDLSGLQDVLKGKTTILSGHSGSGKSTLLNVLAPHFQQSVGEISDYSEKGVHTTTFAEIFQIEPDTWIIDTPGIKEWGLSDMGEQELSDYFPEMRERRLDCKFGSRCIHVHEPHCAILKAVENGQIAMSRYESYLSMISGEDNRK
jgi:ribosome biogenesis GTPase